MSIRTISTGQLRCMGDQEGLILQGCGGDPQEWVDGINEILAQECILKKGAGFEEAYTFRHDGLTCMLFPFKEDMELDIGKLAAWRLASYSTFGGTWLSDYVPNRLGGFIQEQKTAPERVKPDCPLIGEDGKLFGKKKKVGEERTRMETKSFFDCIAPATIRFYANYFLVGDTYRCVWVIREYPPSTEEQAILSHLADHSGVTLRIYNRLVEAYEQRQIANNAARKNRLKLGDTDINESIQAEQNLLDVQRLLVTLSREKQPLIHCAAFLELKARSMSALESLQSDISMELTRSTITVDRLTLRQKEGFLSAMPFGCNRFGSQFERVLPASAIGNMFPFNFSGKTDPKGFYIGRDKYGTNILADLDRRADDKTNSNILILGNSGQGKSYLIKLLLTNLREAGKRVLVLDAEGEYGELAENNGGCCLDLLDGQYMVNILEPKVWASEPVEDPDAPEAFRKSGRIGQHIAFLKDWFRSYKDFTDAEVDTIEIMLSQLYREFGLTEKTDFSKLKPENYPILSDLYKLCLQEYYCYDKKNKLLYTEETLRNICLGLNSICVGSESRFFNGHTNIQDNMFLVFGVKGVMDLNKNLACSRCSSVKGMYRPMYPPVLNLPTC